ncbi:Uncharacterised protein [Capnocytophaga ochracea]|uniref:Uncharacterized protein n=1 Tax=Capnocytophaga ochracea TaxID=1018 RepID=A0A2X2THC8_CAPOC|nr:Uncharacterised protein [Capnocytophaga ochracea]
MFIIKLKKPVILCITGFFSTLIYPPYLGYSFNYRSSFLYLPVWLAPSFVHLHIQTLPKFETLAKLKSTNNILLIYILVLIHLHFFSAFCSFFVRSLFVLCSFFVRLLFVFCSSFVRLLFVFCSSFVRLFFICPCGSHRLLFICLSCYDCLCGSHYLLVVLQPRIVLPFTFYL